MQLISVRWLISNTPGTLTTFSRRFKRNKDLDQGNRFCVVSFFGAEKSRLQDMMFRNFLSI